MKRKDFYIEYYNRTNRVFSDKMIWGKKEREEAWRKAQHLTSKFERKLFILFQYLVLLLCWIPICFDRKLWVVIPIALLLFLLQSFITDYSILKIEMLYFIYSKNSVYCSILHDLFTGSFAEFLNELTRLTKKEVTGFILISGGKFYGKFRAVCRNKSKKIVLRFNPNSVIVTVNEKKFVIKGALHTKEHLILEIAAIINTNK